MKNLRMRLVTNHHEAPIKPNRASFKWMIIVLVSPTVMLDMRKPRYTHSVDKFQRPPSRTTAQVHAEPDTKS